jgi:hypothetical protein
MMRGTMTAEAVRTFVSRRSLLQDVLPEQIVEFTFLPDEFGAGDAINIFYQGIPVAARIPIGPGGIILGRRSA